MPGLRKINVTQDGFALGVGIIASMCTGYKCKAPFSRANEIGIIGWLMATVGLGAAGFAITKTVLNGAKWY